MIDGNTRQLWHTADNVCSNTSVICFWEISSICHLLDVFHVLELICWNQLLSRQNKCWHCMLLYRHVTFSVSYVEFEHFIHITSTFLCSISVKTLHSLVTFLLKVMLFQRFGRYVVRFRQNNCQCMLGKDHVLSSNIQFWWQRWLLNVPTCPEIIRMLKCSL